MITFEISKKNLKVVPTWKEILMVFLIVNGVLFTNFLHLFPDHILIGEFVFIGITIALLSRKSARYVFCISFDDKAEKCTIFYYQFQFFRFKKSIRYSNLGFLYSRIQFTRLQWALTLRILERNNLVVDVREKYNIGYTNEEIATIMNKIREIKQKAYDN